MSSRYSDYALHPTDDPEEECKEWFWVSLGEDETYPKEFLEYLIQMAEDVQSGKVKTYPIEDIKQLFEDLHDDEETTE